LANDALGQLIGAGGIVHAKRNAVVMAEVKLRKIAVQMLFAAMLVDAEHAAFEHTEIAFNRVGGDDRRLNNGLAIWADFVSDLVPVTDVLILLVVDRIVLRELGTEFYVNLGLIGHQMRFFGDVGAYDRRNLVHGSFRRMEAANLSGVAIKQRKDCVLMSCARALLRYTLQAADIGFVSLDRAAIFAHGRYQSADAHCLAQAMHQEPCRFVGNPEHTVHLMGANALLGSVHQEQRGKPLGERDFGALKNRVHGHRELQAALGLVALVYASAVGVALKLGDLVLIGVAAVRAIRAFRPNPSLKPFAGLGFVGKDR